MTSAVVHDARPSSDALPPHDEHAEQALLGAMLVNRQAVADVRELVPGLQPASFYRPAHGDVFQAIVTLDDVGDPADPVTVAAELTRRGDLARVGGAPYLHTLMSTVGTATNAAYYAEIVDEQAKLRCIVRVGQRLVSRAYAGTEPADDLLEQARQDLDVGTGSSARADSWSAIDLAPYLAGEISQEPPTVGMARTDGLRLLYAGKEHSVIAEMEAGKTWYCLACVAAELLTGNSVVYVHFEESDPSSTIERLVLLGVPAVLLGPSTFRFVGPDEPVTPMKLRRLLEFPGGRAPSLAVMDGVNEGMVLHGFEIYDPKGAAQFRQALIKPMKTTGAAVLVADHVVKDPEKRGRYALGSIHKGNAIDGTQIMLENAEPFGRGLRGRSHVYATKDRPGYLRSGGRPTKVPGKTFLGELVVDDSQSFGPDFTLKLWPPAAEADEQQPPDVMQLSLLHESVLEIVRAAPDTEVASVDILMAALRVTGRGARKQSVTAVVNDLEALGQIERLRRGSARPIRLVRDASEQGSGVVPGDLVGNDSGTTPGTTHRPPEPDHGNGSGNDS